MTPERFRELRTTAFRYTQGRMASKLGVTRRTILRWEHGEHPIPSIAGRCIFYMLRSKNLNKALARLKGRTLSPEHADPWA